MTRVENFVERYFDRETTISWFLLDCREIFRMPNRYRFYFLVVNGRKLNSVSIGLAGVKPIASCPILSSQGTHWLSPCKSRDQIGRGDPPTSVAHFSVTRDFSRINAFLFFPILLCRECAETHPYSKFSKVLVSNGSFILHADWTSRELRGERLNWTSFHIFPCKRELQRE